MAFIVPCKHFQWTRPASMQCEVSTHKRSYGRRHACTRMKVMAVHRLDSNGSVEGRCGDENMAVLQRSSFSSRMNKASKWLAMLLASGVLLYRHDNHTVWALVGSVINGGVCKGLKYLINEDRPRTADGVKEDPGMPSSHAQGFAFLGTYASLALLFSRDMQVWTVICASGIVLGTLYLSWLRVVEGLHTGPQVLMGSLLGSAVAAFWLWIWKAGLGAAIEAHPVFRNCLLIAFCISFVCTFIIVFREWEPGQP